MQPGDIIAERFEIERLAGQGGMGLIYQARDLTSGLPVALKVIFGAGATNEQRFAREAGILAALSHPAIVGYVAHGHAPEGTYIAMEWLEGEDLASRLLRSPALTRAESVMLVRQVASALGAAHAAGIVHRDIKPSNIFLVDGRADRVKLLDFGVARLATASRQATRTGAVLGTPWYMAPEQASGSHAVDARADIFSLGCVLFECLTGAPPFDGDAPIAVLANILLAEAPRLCERFAGVPAELDELIGRMLDKVPDARPENGAALADELGRLGVLDGGRRARMSERAPALTDSEQRLFSLLIAQAPADASGADEVTVCLNGKAEAQASPVHASEDLATQRTFEVLPPGPASLGLGRALAPYGASVHVLVDGSLLALVSGDGRPSDQVARIARSALVARDLMPEARLAVATGRGVLAARLPVGDVVERALGLVAGGRGLPGAVRIDDVTAGLLSEGFELGGDVHGLTLLAERQGPASVRTLLGKPMPYLGRQRELATLEAAAVECREERVARVVLVTGEAGVGKSRLRHELLERLRQREEDWDVWLCRQNPLAAASPYGLLGPALRRAAGILDGEPLAVRRHKLRARLQRHLAEGAAATTSLGHACTFLGELAGVPAEGPESPELEAARRDPLLMGDQIRRAFGAFVAAEAAAHPLVVVLDDLQWGDTPSLELLDAVLRAHPDVALFVLALGRPEVEAIFPRLFAQRGLHRLPLGPLTRRASEQLVRHALGPQADVARVTTIVERSGGNPFFLEELVRAAEERRGRSPGSAERHLAELPGTVLAIVQARLEALEPDARRVLRAASVFGATFWRGGLVQLLGRDCERTGWLERWLEVLCERELVAPSSECRFPNEREYTFRNLCVRDAAYAILTPEDRRLGHRLGGSWLERAGETDAAILAEHFERGGDVRAGACFRRAAAQALEAHDFATTLVRALRGLDCQPSPELSAELHLLGAEAQRWLGRYPDALASAEQAVALVPVGSAGWYRAAEELLTAALRLGRTASAPHWAEQLLAEPHELGAASVRVRAMCQAVRVLFQGGEYRRADVLLAGIDELLATVPELTRRARYEAHRVRGARARHVGDVGADFEGYRAALAHCEAGDEREACNARVSLGFAYVELGAYPEARALLEQALEAARAMGLDAVATRARQNLSLVAAAEGDVSGARALAESVLAATQTHGDRQLEAWTRIYLGRFAADAREAGEAASQARRAFALLDPNAPARVGALAVLARALVQSGHVTRGACAARAAMRLLVSFGGIEEFEALVRLAYVEAMEASGERDEAVTALAEARTRLSELASGIADERFRHTFLERVMTNRALMTRPEPGRRDCRAVAASGS